MWLLVLATHSRHSPVGSSSQNPIFQNTRSSPSTKSHFSLSSLSLSPLSSSCSPHRKALVVAAPPPPPSPRFSSITLHSTLSMSWAGFSTASSTLM